MPCSFLCTRTQKGSIQLKLSASGTRVAEDESSLLDSIDLWKFMKNNTVCLINLKLLAIHNHIIVFIIHPEERHRV